MGQAVPRPSPLRAGPLEACSPQAKGSSWGQGGSQEAPCPLAGQKLSPSPATGGIQQLCTALGPGTKHNATEGHGYLGFGLNGSPVVQQDLCNSHMSIASCTVERGQLILGRQKGSRAHHGQGRAGVPSGRRVTGTLDFFFFCKIRQN